MSNLSINALSVAPGVKAMSSSADKSDRGNEATSKVRTKAITPITQIDYRSGQMPKWVKEAIEEQYNRFCRSRGSRFKSAYVSRLFKRPTSRTGWQLTWLCLVCPTALF